MKQFVKYLKTKGIDVSKHYDQYSGLITEIVQRACDLTGVSVQELSSKKNYGNIPKCKMIIARVMYDRGYSFTEIYNILPEYWSKGSIHTRVKRSVELEKTNKTFKAVIIQIKSEIKQA